jgi:hypothetical protein
VQLSRRFADCNLKHSGPVRQAENGIANQRKENMMIGQSESFVLDKPVQISGPAPAQYTIATMGSDGASFSQAANSFYPLMGIFQTAPASNVPQYRLRVIGLSWCRAGAAINMGDLVTSDANGNGIPSNNAPGANDYLYIVGMAMGSAPEGGLFPVLILPQLSTVQPSPAQDPEWYA